MDRKWSDEQRETVARAHIVDGLSMAAAGRLVRDADGNPMPKGTVKYALEKVGDRFMLRDASAALARLEQLRLECARQTAELIAGSLKSHEQSTADVSRLAHLDRMAAALQKQIAALRPVARPEKPAKADPQGNGHVDHDPAVAAILAG